MALALKKGLCEELNAGMIASLLRIRSEAQDWVYWGLCLQTAQEQYTEFVWIPQAAKKHCYPTFK